MSHQFVIGTNVAWSMLDGNTMAGEVTEDGFYPRLTVRRIDGGTCTLDASDVRLMTHDDHLAAVAFFANIGKR